MTVLLTGGAGYIGSHIAAQLLSMGRKVVIADNFINSSPTVPDRISEITGTSARLYPMDVSDGDALDRIFEENDIAAVIHLAGHKAIGQSMACPGEYYQNNLGCTMALLGAMARVGIDKLIFSSSASVYGDPEKVPFDENSPVGNCTSPYGRTKYISELMIADEVRVRPELSAVMLRYFNPLGSHPSGKLGDQPLGTPENLMPFITQTAVGKQKELKVFGNDYPTPDGTAVRDYIHVSDLVRGHILALEYCLEHTGLETFNLGAGRGYSVLEVIAAFEHVTGVRVAHRFAPRRPGDVAAMWTDTKKVRERLGFAAEKSLEDMCRDSWNWQKNNPNGYEVK